jgi:hypothetical protein
MRKSKIKINNVDGAFFATLAAEPSQAIARLESISVSLPEWAKLVLFALRADRQSVEVAFFEDARDFFLAYTKKVLRRPDDQQPPEFLCVSREGADWRNFVPPTLIGTNLKTRLRKP